MPRFEIHYTDTVRAIQRTATPKRLIAARNYVWELACKNLPEDAKSQDAAFEVTCKIFRGAPRDLLSMPVLNTDEVSALNSKDPIFMLVAEETTYADLAAAIVETVKYWARVDRTGYNTKSTVIVDKVKYEDQGGDLPLCNERKDRWWCRGDKDGIVLVGYNDVDSLEGRERLAEQSRELQIISDNLKRLTRRQKKFLLLRHRDGLRLMEIGKQMGVCSSQASRLCNEALDLLREKCLSQLASEFASNASLTDQ